MLVTCREDVRHPRKKQFNTTQTPAQTQVGEQTPAATTMEIVAGAHNQMEKVANSNFFVGGCRVTFVFRGGNRSLWIDSESMFLLALDCKPRRHPAANLETTMLL